MYYYRSGNAQWPRQAPVWFANRCGANLQKSDCKTLLLSTWCPRVTRLTVYRQPQIGGPWASSPRIGGSEVPGCRAPGSEVGGLKLRAHWWKLNYGQFGISSSELQPNNEKLNYGQFGNLKLRAPVRGPTSEQVSRTAFRVEGMVHLHKKLSVI